MCDKLLRAMAQDAGIRVSAALTTGLVEQARMVHKTLPVATAALGRTLTAAAIMGEQLKTEKGSVTIRFKGDGPLGSIIAVGEADGYVRGYLQNPACVLPLRQDGKLDVGGAVGRGYVSVIKDVGLKEPITGMVELVNGEIAEDLTRYFAESEQTPSACALGVLVNVDQSVKCAGGYIIQLMPGVTEEQILHLEHNIAIAGAVTTMLEQGLSLQDIIARVLDGFTIRYFEDTDIGYRCNCSQERVLRALVSLGRTELQKMAEDEKGMEVTCQFCDRVFCFSQEEIAQLIQPI